MGALNTAVVQRTIPKVVNEGNLQEIADALRMLGFAEMVTPVKRTFSAVTSATAQDLTALDSTEETAAGINGSANPYRRAMLIPVAVRVVAGVAAAGTRQVGDADTTPTTGIVALSNDGKTITFENTVTGFVVVYVPRPKVNAGPLPSRAVFTCVAVASLADGDYFSICDGVHQAMTFEYKVTGGYAHVAGRTTIDVSALTTNAEVATATANAINTAAQAGGLYVLAMDPVTNVFVVNNLVPGAQGNKAIVEVVANAGYTIVGMTGGADAAVFEILM